MVPIPTKRPLPFLRPPILLTGPITAEELPNTGVTWLFLRRLERNQLVEVLVDGGGFTIAAVGGVGWTVPG